MTKQLGILALILSAGAVTAPAAQLITNGAFETGTLSGWTVTTETGSTSGSSFFADKLPTAPLSSDVTAGPASGAWYAVSDDTGPAAIILSQSFTVAKGSSVTLSFSMFVDSNAASSVNTSNGLDFNAINSQFGMVSLLSAGTSLFSTTTGDLQNFYSGVDTVNANDPYKSYSFNISSLVSAGGTYILRFAAVNNVDQLNLGVDNVSVVSTATPEPASVGLALLGLAGIVRTLKRKKRSA